jgi:hypothetical protein
MDAFCKIEELEKKGKISSDEGRLFANVIMASIDNRHFDEEYGGGNQFIFLKGYFYGQGVSIERVYNLSKIYCKTFIWEE